MEDIAVSILCAAYNHAPYIAQALNSFLNQKTSFRYEIIIHDDASTDGTDRVIEKYSAEHPNVIRPIFQSENQYRINPNRVMRNMLDLVRGKYIAICDGDDWWTDEQKLQIQYDWMEAHPDVDMCSHASVYYRADTNEVLGTHRPYPSDRLIDVQDVIRIGGEIVSTSSLFYRSSLESPENKLEFRSFLQFDYSHEIADALRGGMMYLDRPMSAYRKFSNNSWTAHMKQNRDDFCKYKDKVIEMLKILDRETDRRYHDAIYYAMMHEEYLKLYSRKDYAAMIRHPYYGMMPLKSRIRPLLNYVIRRGK